MQDFQPDYIIKALRQNTKQFQQIYQDMDAGLLHYRSAEGKWNLLEVLCHLRDEEETDFRARVKAALDSSSDYPPMDPEGWVEERKYAEQDVKVVLEEYVAQRRQSDAWLSNLSEPNWSNCLTHPRLGTVTAARMLSNWLAHDYLHLRQINRICYQYLKSTCDQDLSYAGDW